MDLLALILAVLDGDQSEQAISSAVSAWITAHPEAVTTVQDGAISRAKLDADLQEKTDAVGGLKSAIQDVSTEVGDLKADLYKTMTSTGNPIVETSVPGGSATITTEAAKVYHFAKNMLAVDGRTAVTTGEASNETVRDLTGYKLFVGLGSSNYFYNNQIDSYSVSGKTVTVTNKGLIGYGLAFTIPHVVGGKKMVISAETQTNAAIKVGFYNNGTYISNFTANNANLGKFEVPATANQLIVCIEPSAANTTATVTGVQLEYAESSTDYSAPIVPEEITVTGGSVTSVVGKNFTLSSTANMSVVILSDEWSFADDFATPTEVDETVEAVAEELTGEIDNLKAALFESEELSGNPLVGINVMPGKAEVETEANKFFAFAKNMLAIADRTAVTTGEQSNVTVRDLTGYKLFVGLGSSNYFVNSQIDSYSISGKTVTVTNKNLIGYGLAFTIPHVVGGETMVISAETQTNAAIKIGFYNNGTYISNFTANNANHGVFDVPATANQLIVCVEPSAANTTATVTGVQLEYADEATAYSAPIVPKEITVTDGSATVDIGTDFTLSASASMAMTVLKTDEWSFADDFATTAYVDGKIADAKKSWFYGKKICTFGDSITAMNKWQPFMAEYLGCTYTKHGVGGCTVALTTNEEHLTDCMYMDSRINELEADADVILVFGGHNDWSNRVPIGSFPTDNTLELNDNGDTTEFVYAYALMLKKLMARFPNARIYTMSCLGGRWDDTLQHYSDGHYYINGISMEDYADAAKMVSAYYAIPCIDISSLSGINVLNHETYLADAIHPNVAGGKRIAEVVVRELLRMEPIDYTSDWDDIKNTYNVTGQ